MRKLYSSVLILEQNSEDYGGDSITSYIHALLEILLCVSSHQNYL